MSEEMAKQAVKVLAENYKRHFPADGMKAIWQELSKQPDDAIAAAVDNIVLNSTYLPSPAQLLEKVKTESKLVAAKESRQRELEWAEKKGGETPEQIRRAGSIFTTEQQDAHARHAVQAVRLMLSPAARADKLECFRQMDKSYPGIGWAMEGMRREKDIVRNDKRPHWRDVAEASPQFQLNYQREQERKGLLDV